MNKLKTSLLLVSISITVYLSGCQPKSEKITDIPITTKSDDARASVKQGLALSDAGDNERAKTFFAKAIEQDPKLAIAYILKSGTNVTPKEFADNLNQAKANLEGASDWEKWYSDYFNTFMTSDQNKRLEVTKKIAATYPDAPRAQVDLGNAFSGGNDIANARDSYQKAISMDPKWVGGYVALLNSYLFMEPKDFKKAEENALKVTELAPQSAGAQIALGDCYRAQQNLEKARDAYGKAVQLDPDVSEPYYKKGHANTFLGNYDEARQNYMDGGKHDDASSTSVQFSAYTFLYDGDCKKALTYLTDETSKLNASGKSKDKIDAAKMNYMENCADIAMHCGDATQLKEIVSMMEPLRIEMGNTIGTEEARLTEKAAMCYWQSIAATMEGNFDVGKTKAEEIKTIMEPVKDPFKTNNYEFALGYNAMKQKNYSDATAHFGKIIQPSVYHKYWLAMADEALGNKDKANELYKEISNFNFNGIEYALIRKEVKTKMASLQ